MSKKVANSAQSSASPKEKIALNAITLAAKLGWAHVTLSDIAQESDLSLAQLSTYVDDKGDIVALIARMVDRKVLEAVSSGGADLSPRERLFDVLMERFDVLNEHRAGVVSILESFRFDPKQAVFTSPHLCRSMSWMLEAGGIDTSGLRGAVKVAGLTALYLKTLRVWKSDDSPDMARVMAALDKDLGRIEGLADSLHL